MLSIGKRHRCFDGFNSGAASVAPFGVLSQTGVRRFCSSSDAVIHFDPNTAGVTTRTTTGVVACSAAPYLVLQ